VKPENQVPYAKLSEGSKELDRASVRAVLAFAAAPEGTERMWVSPVRPDGLVNLNYGDRMIASGLSPASAGTIAAIVNECALTPPSPAVQQEGGE
jgi:hypothetical protein